MSTVDLSRAARQHMRRLDDENGPTIAADRRFFERRPGRTYRIRRASRAELAKLAVARGSPLPAMASSSAPVAVVKQIAAGVRLKIFVPGPADEDGASASDGLGAFLWDRYAAAHPAVAEREAAIRGALFGPGGPLHDGGDR